MQTRTWVVVLGALALACGEPKAESSTGAPADSVPAADSAPAVDEADAIPEDWVWVTETRGRFEVAMPALPRSFSTDDPSARDMHVLQADLGRAIYGITSRPASTGPSLEALERDMASKGTVSERAPWHEHGLGLTLTGTATVVGAIRVRAVVEDEWLYTLEVAGEASAADANRYFDSFEARTEPRRGTLHDAQRGYRVEAPARLGRWRDVSGMPPLLGHRGVLDGHQLGVNVNDLLVVPDPEAALDGAVTNMRRTFGGQLMEIDPRRFQGHPSRRLELRAEEGVYATIRLVLDGSRLYQASVYAPTGREATWANEFVDSLVVGE